MIKITKELLTICKPENIYCITIPTWVLLIIFITGAIIFWLGYFIGKKYGQGN